MRKYKVIYCEADNPTVKTTVVESFGEAFLRVECEGKGWQVLLIQDVEHIRDCCLYAAAPYMSRRRICRL